MRPLLRRFDALVSRAQGIFVFSAHPDNLLRLQSSRAPRRIELLEIRRNDPVLFLHLWNDRLPALPSSGADFAWARRASARLVCSLRLAAQHIQSDPALRSAKAIGGVTILLFPDGRSGGARLMQRLGFTVVPYHSPLGRFGEFWENLYSWILLWAFNPAALRGRSLSRLHRAEFWMPLTDFLLRFG